MKDSYDESKYLDSISSYLIWCTNGWRDLKYDQCEDIHLLQLDLALRQD